MSEKELNMIETQGTSPLPATAAQKTVASAAPGPLRAESAREVQSTGAPQGLSKPQTSADASEKAGQDEARSASQGKGKAPAAPETPPAMPAAGTEAARPKNAPGDPAEIPADTPAARAGEPGPQPETASTAASAESNQVAKASEGSRPAKESKESPEKTEALAAGAPTSEGADARREVPEIEHSPKTQSKAPDPQDPNAQATGAETATPAAPSEKPAAASQVAASGHLTNAESQTAKTSDADRPSVSSSGAPDQDGPHDAPASGNPDSEKKPTQGVDFDNLIKEKIEAQGKGPEKTENAKGGSGSESDPDKNPLAPARGESRAPKSSKAPPAPEARDTEAAQEKPASTPAGTGARAGSTEHSAEKGQPEPKTPGEEAKDETGPLFPETARDASGPEPDSDAPAPAGVTGLRAQPLLTRSQRIGAGAMAAVALAVGLAIFGATRHEAAPDAAPKADSILTSPKTLTLPPVPPVPALLAEKALEKPKAPAAANPGSEEKPEPKPTPKPLVPDIREAARTSGESAAPAAPAERKPTEAEERYGAPLALTSTAPKNERAEKREAEGRGAAPGTRLAATGADAVRARAIGGRSLLLPKGAVIECVLETRIDTTVPGMTTCVIPRDVWSADGRVLLLEKGSRATGEYRGAVQKGLARVFLLWNRIVTPRGVAIDLDSPAADPLGGAGIPGPVDHHWWARFGNALLFSLVQDAFDFGVARETKAAGGVNYYSSTTDSMDEIVKEAMRQAGDIPPTLTKPQGSRISLVASRDLDFSDVYRVAVAEAALPARLPAAAPALEGAQGAAR